MWHLHSVMFFAAAMVLSGCRFGETSGPREDDEDVEDDLDAGEPVQSAKEYCASLAAEVVHGSFRRAVPPASVSRSK